MAAIKRNVMETYEISDGYSMLYSSSAAKVNEIKKLLKLSSYPKGKIRIRKFNAIYWAYLHDNETKKEHLFYKNDGLEDIIDNAERVFNSLSMEDRNRFDIYVEKYDKNDLFYDNEGWLTITNGITIYYNGCDLKRKYTVCHSKVSQNGNSLTVSITDAAKKLGIERGDTITILIQKTPMKYREWERK